MNILYISYDGMSDSLGQSQVLGYLKHLKNFHRFTLISFEKKEKVTKIKFLNKIVNYNDIIWIPLSYTKYPLVLSTLMDIAKGLIIFLKIKKPAQINVIHARGYIAGTMALLINIFFKVPFVFDMRGWMIDENIERGSWSHPIYSPIISIFRKIELELVIRSKHIVCLTMKAKSILINNYKINLDKIDVIPTCVDSNNFSFNKEIRNVYRKKLGLLPQDFLLIYTGSVGGYYNLEEMLIFYAQLKAYHKQSKFLILTDQIPCIILSKAKKLKIAQEDIIINSVSFNNVNKYLCAADAGLVLYDNTFSSTGRSPTKLGEYWANGLRVFAPKNVGDLNRYFIDQIVGVQFILKDHISYRNAINSFNYVKFSRYKVAKNTNKFFALINGVQGYLQVYNKIFT